MDLSYNKIAEIVQANSNEFMAQCYKLGQAPALGTLVKVNDENYTIYGIVYRIETRSLDPARRIIARGSTADSVDDIFQTNPQLSKLLTTDINGLVIGYEQEESVYHYLPPNPVPIHGFVYICTKEEVCKFEESVSFIDLLVNAKLIMSTDEVIAAHLRYTSSVFPDPMAYLVKAGKALAILLSNDVVRLNYILKRLR
jgi:hypothetical protein